MTDPTTYLHGHVTIDYCILFFFFFHFSFDFSSSVLLWLLTILHQVRSKITTSIFCAISFFSAKKHRERPFTVQQVTISITMKIISLNDCPIQKCNLLQRKKLSINCAIHFAIVGLTVDWFLFKSIELRRTSNTCFCYCVLFTGMDTPKVELLLLYWMFLKE